MSTAVCIVGSVLFAAAAVAQPGGEVTVLAVSGDPVPGSTENFLGFKSPVINNNDEVVFWYRAGSGSQTGYALYSNGSLSVPIRSGDTLGNGDSFQDFRALNTGGAGQQFVSLTDSGTIVCKSGVLEMSAGTSYVALLRVNGGSPEVVAREGQSLPDGSGDLVGTFENARVNQAGDVAFISSLNNIVPPRTNNGNTILIQADGTLTPVILSWNTGPGNRVSGPRDLALSDSGTIATSIFEQIAGVSESKAVLWDNGSLTTLAVAGVPIPGIGTISGFGGNEGQFIIDEQGTASFFVTLPFENFDMNSAILSADSTSLFTLVQEGVDLPSNANQNDLQGLGNSITTNRSGSVSFATNNGVYLKRPSGLLLVAQDGDSVHEGASELTVSHNAMALNNNDQLAFLADIQTIGAPTADSEGIYFYSDSLGFVELLTRGDPLLGSMISDIGFIAENISGEESNGLSDAGLVAFSFSLTDGRSGIAVIDPFTQPCLADVNGDGLVTPTDFTAWINAFNNQLPECDQNGDGSCTPTDFTAWIANFNAGCP